MDYMTAGLVSMLEHGLIDASSDIHRVRDACPEPDVHEIDDAELEALLEGAKLAFAAR